MCFLTSNRSPPTVRQTSRSGFICYFLSTPPVCYSAIQSSESPRRACFNPLSLLVKEPEALFSLSVSVFRSFWLLLDGLGSLLGSFRAVLRSFYHIWFLFGGSFADATALVWQTTAFRAAFRRHQIYPRFSTATSPYLWHLRSFWAQAVFCFTWNTQRYCLSLFTSGSLLTICSARNCFSNQPLFHVEQSNFYTQCASAALLFPYFLLLSHNANFHALSFDFLHWWQATRTAERVFRFTVFSLKPLYMMNFDVIYANFWFWRARFFLYVFIAHVFLYLFWTFFVSSLFPTFFSCGFIHPTTHVESDYNISWAYKLQHIVNLYIIYITSARIIY